jgi:Tfp pilus assembly protein PilO
MRRLSAQEQVRIATFVLAVGTVVTIVSRFLIAPAWRNAKQLKNQMTVLAEQVRGLEVSTVGAENLELQHAALEGKVRALQNALPPETELPSIIELLSSLAGQTSFRIQTIFPQRSSTEDPSARLGPAQPLLYKTIPIQIDALAGFHQLGAFLSLVEAHDKPLRIASLRISSQQKEAQFHRIKLVIDSYVSMAGGSK